MKRINLLISIFLVFSLINLVPSCLGYNDESLRISVLNDADSLTLNIKGQYSIATLNTDEVIREGRDLFEARVVPTRKGLTISREPFDIYGVKIIPSDNASVSIGKRSFRGKLDIIRKENEKLLVINHVGLEDYLKGVLYHEVSHWWPMETLKAQAITARTYALYQRSLMQQRDFDLTNDIYSQVYGGKHSERLKTNIAVDKTRGMVLAFDNAIFPTYYHATCGGRTEDSVNIWDIELLPLKGVKCIFCKYSPHYKWKKGISFDDIKNRLSNAGYEIGQIQNLDTTAKNTSGRIEYVSVLSTKELKIPANDFRLAMGPNIIRSTNFSLKVKN